MYRQSCTNVDPSLIDCLNDLLKRFSVRLEPVAKEPSLQLIKQMGDYNWCIETTKQNHVRITYASNIYLFKAIGLFASSLSNNLPIPDCCELKNPLKKRSVLLDCSRDAVFKVQTIKNYIQHMALLGLDTLYLYLEDLYEVEQYPYFGYLRGRYSSSELEAILHYCECYSIRLIFSIQTLAHLKHALRWEYARELKDTDDILYVGKEEVHRFLDALIGTVSSISTTRIIHLGMDEAAMLGLGNRFAQEGYTDQKALFRNHLDLVLSICRKYDLKPIVFSDMFFSLEMGNASIDVDDSLTLCCWDYYHLEQSWYENRLQIHKRITKNLSFACGAWTFNGIAPNYSLATASMEAAINACKQQEIEEVICTVWFDDGAETPLAVSLPMLAYFSHLTSDYKQAPSFTVWFSLLFSIQFDQFLLLDAFDCIPYGTASNQSSDNPSKWLLYQDPLIGLFDTYAAKFNSSKYYHDVSASLQNVQTSDEHLKLLFSYYHQLALFLSTKADLGCTLQSAYKKQDTVMLNHLLQTTIPRCISNLQILTESRRTLWFYESKAFGYEVLDIRLSALLGRLTTTKWRLKSYLEGSMQVIEELEEERLDFRQRAPDSNRSYAACNRWQEIVSPSFV